MKFKVSSKEIRRLKYAPLYVFAAIMIFPILGVLTNAKYNYIEVYTISTILAVVISAIVFMMNYASVKNMPLHALEVNSKGLIFYNSGSEELIPWNTITKVHVVNTKKDIKIITIEVVNGIKINLSIYRNLETLNSELKKYLRSDLWVKPKKCHVLLYIFKEGCTELK